MGGPRSQTEKIASRVAESLRTIADTVEAMYQNDRVVVGEHLVEIRRLAREMDELVDELRRADHRAYTRTKR